MSRFNACRLLAVLTIACLGWSGLVDARPARVNQIPNGSKFRCASCHVNPSGGGDLTPFGTEINQNYLTPSGRSGIVDWNAALAMLDSDGDGVSNGRELGDPDGAFTQGGNFTPDPNITVTNPGDRNDFAQLPEDKAPRATSVMIGNMTINADVKNPPVPTGRQTLSINFDAPLVVSKTDSSSGSDPGSGADIMPSEASGGIELVNTQVMIYPTALMTTASNWAVSDDKMTFTVTLNLPENATYQMIIGNPSASQQYFFGTVALSDAVVSGRAMLPSGFALSDEPGPGLAVLIDSEAYSDLLAVVDDSDDLPLGQFFGQLIEGGLSTIVRISHFGTLESLPEQLAFELKHVPDGSYILSLNQSAVGAEGDLVDLSAVVGLDAMGTIDSNTLIRVANGERVTGLQVALQSESEIEPEATNIQQVRVKRIDADNNRFFVQSDGREVTVSVTVATQGDTTSTGTLFATTTGASNDLNEILSSLVGQGMIPGIGFFSFNQLMAGDTVSILGFSGSGSAIQALIVLRHSASAIIGDLNGDNQVNFADFLLFAAAFGKGVGDAGYNPKADLNNDNEVNFADFLLFAANFGN